MSFVSSSAVIDSYGRADRCARRLGLARSVERYIAGFISHASRRSAVTALSDSAHGRLSRSGPRSTDEFPRASGALGTGDPSMAAGCHPPDLLRLDWTPPRVVVERNRRGGA